MNTESFTQTKDTVQRLAVDAFKDHVLTADGDGRWVCRRPERGAYWFRLITSPGAIIVLGDVGEMVLRFQSDPIPWLRGAVQSPDYLLEKVQASKEPPKEFYPVDCLAWLRGYSKDSPRVRAALAECRERHRGDGLWHEKWLEIASDHGIDDVYSVAMYPSSRMLWMVEVCKCFIRLHDAQKVTEAA